MIDRTRIPAMVERKLGTISSWVDITPELAAFRLKAQPGSRFPPYKAGQYIALTRQNCKLTVRVKDHNGVVQYTPLRNTDGSVKLGPVTHSYSIASAPFETNDRGELEIYVTLEKYSDGQLGRFTESLFRASSHVGDSLGYVDRIVGNFTLDDRAAGAEYVVMVGTGTGLAPFVGMMKQAAHDAKHGHASPAGYTLIHANRTVGELGYDDQLRKLEEQTIPGFDFKYVRSVSRPTAADANDPILSQGRANNLLRSILGLPTREQEEVEEARAAGRDVAAALQALDRSTRPGLGSGVDGKALRARMPEGRTTVLTCGNRAGMEDIRRICEKAGYRFEMEEW
jgi:ferredoxin-NADP reductase